MLPGKLQKARSTHEAGSGQAARRKGILSIAVIARDLATALRKAAYGKAAHFPVGVISQAEKRNPRNKHANPSEAENDPQQHHSL